MDIISYGVASTATKKERYTRLDVLGEDVKGNFSSMKKRIDNIDRKIGVAVKQADKLIIQNAINIMKANDKLNAVAQSKKYYMEDMFFDDLLDDSGIDLAKSQDFTHDAALGLISSTSDECIIQTTEEHLLEVPKKLLLSLGVDSGKVLAEASRDGGKKWEVITPDTLFYFKDRVSDPDQTPTPKSITLRFSLDQDTTINHIALTWAYEG